MTSKRSLLPSSTELRMSNRVLHGLHEHALRANARDACKLMDVTRLSVSLERSRMCE
jgi:hypothetical protein